MTWNNVSHFQLASKTGKYNAKSCFRAALWVFPSNRAKEYRENACINGAKIKRSNNNFFASGNDADSSGNSLSTVS